MGLLSDFSGLNPRSLFVETGTWEGCTLEQASRYFERCISIEFNRILFERAVRRFANSSCVSIYHGNSSDVLSQVLDPKIPTTFWLDAHYTGNEELKGPGGECPLLAELEAIMLLDWKQDPIILIDDAYMFDRNLPSPQDLTCFNLVEWPSVNQLDAKLPGYKRALRGKDIFEYRKGETP